MINVVNVTLPSNCGEADYCILLCFFTMRWKNWIFFTCFLMSSGTLDQPLALPSASATDDEARLLVWGVGFSFFHFHLYARLRV